jgi:hypothetical protein
MPKRTTYSTPLVGNVSNVSPSVRKFSSGPLSKLGLINLDVLLSISLVSKYHEIIETLFALTHRTRTLCGLIPKVLNLVRLMSMILLMTEARHA